MSWTAIFINIFALVCLMLALIKDRAKVWRSLTIAARSLVSIFPSVLMIVLFIGLVLGFIPQEMISRTIGKQAGVSGILLAAVSGSVLHIPSIISFPLAASLLQQGATVTAMATFITTLTMIGMVTLPLEMKELGKKFALWRNGISFIAALLIGLLMGWIL